MTGTIGGDTLTMPVPTGDEAIFRAVTTSGRTVTGAVYKRGSDFLAFVYFEEISSSVLADGPKSSVRSGSTLVLDQPVFGFWGTPTDFDAFHIANDDAQIRTYDLSANPMHSFRTGSTHELYFLNPFAADALGAGFLDTVSASKLMVVGSDSMLEEDPRFLVASLGIQGTGSAQKSAVSIGVGEIVSDGLGGYQLEGERRGGHRANAGDAAVVYGGAVSSIAAADGSHFFGEDANNFVVGHSIDTLEAGLDASARQPQPYSDVTQTASGYIHVASLDTVSPTNEFLRATRSLNGYGSAMVESTQASGTPIPFWSNTPSNLRLSFDAERSSAGALLRVSDNFMRSPHLASLTIGFGDNLNETGSDGASAFVDDDRYALSHNRGATRAELDGLGVISHTSARTPRSYMIPSTLVKGGDAALFQSVTRCTCAFLEWGYWGTRFVADPATSGIGESRDFVHLGTWAAGDTPTYSQLPMAGSATYTGHAVGTVAAGGPSAPSQYLAAGTFSMTYGFASRMGSATISNFDGRTFTGGVEQPEEFFAGDLNRFSGTLGEIDGSATGTLNGSFVRGPASVAQGVIGSFGLRDPGDTWTATGIIVGDSITGPQM